MSAESLWHARLAELLQDSERAFLIALRASGRSAIAEEAVQEGFARLLQRPPPDLSPEQLRFYFFKVVRSVALNMARSSRSRRLREVKYVPESTAESLDDVKVTREAAGLAKALLAGLPFEERETVSLCCEQGLSQKNASEILNVPTQTVSDRVKRGLQKLRQALQQQGFASFKLASLGAALSADNPDADWRVLRFGVDEAIVPEEWRTEDGNWQFKDSDFISQALENVLVWKTEVPASFRFIAEGWLEHSGELSLIGHRASPDFKNYSKYSGYYFEFGAEFNSCVKFARGLTDVLARFDLKVEAQRRYRLELEYRDQEGLVLCHIDGKRIFTYRELAPFPGNHLGFYAWGGGTHLRPLEVHIQNWTLQVPALRAADRLIQYGQYAAAFEAYAEVARSSSHESQVLEARLKMGICQGLLEHTDAAAALFKALAATPLEPYALAEEALLYLRNEPGDRPAQGVRTLTQLHERFPNSPAKARALDAADDYRRLKVIHGSDRTQDLQYRADVQRLGSLSIEPPAGSQIKYFFYRVAYLLRLAQWQPALDDMLDFTAKMQPAQRQILWFESVHAAVALANGRDDLLPADLFELHNWLIPHWFDWSGSSLAHAVIRNRQQVQFLTAFENGQGATFRVKGDEHLTALLVCLSQGQTRYSEQVLLNKQAVFASEMSHSTCYWLLTALLEARQEEEFRRNLEIVRRAPSEGTARNFAYTLGALQCRWHLEGGELEPAAQYVAGHPAPELDHPFTSVYLLQVMLASLGLLKTPSADQLRRNYKAVLTGTELDLAEVMFELKDVADVRWPHCHWRPEWRLWLGLWLQARGKCALALETVSPARDERYGPSHSQPAIERLLKKLET